MTTYTVAVTLEDDGNYRARDKNGDWRAYGNARDYTGTADRNLAEFLFHREEIANVNRNRRGILSVELFDFSTPKVL